jgi:hypothetical protein
MDVRSIMTVAGRQVPQGTQLQIRDPGVDPFVDVSIQLPGQSKWTRLGLLVVDNGVVRLPLPVVFLCHATEDETVVAELDARLASDGIATWFAPQKLKGGAAWESEIESAIENADFVVVCVSTHSVNKTGFVQREVKFAFEKQELHPDARRFVIPVLLEQCEVPRRFRGIQWIEFWKPDGYERLKSSLRDPGLDVAIRDSPTMPIGMSRLELVQRWNKTLRELNAKLAPMQGPPGVDLRAFENDPRVVRVPDSPPTYSTYSAYVDISTAVMDLIARNNERVEQQLRSLRLSP